MMKTKLYERLASECNVSIATVKYIEGVLSEEAAQEKKKQEKKEQEKKEQEEKKLLRERDDEEFLRFISLHPSKSEFGRVLNPDKISNAEIKHALNECLENNWLPPQEELCKLVFAKRVDGTAYFPKDFSKHLFGETEKLKDEINSLGFFAIEHVCFPDRSHKSKRVPCIFLKNMELYFRVKLELKKKKGLLELNEANATFNRKKILLEQKWI